MKRIKDWIRPISQFVLLMAIIVLACVFNAAELLASCVAYNGFTENRKKNSR